MINCAPMVDDAAEAVAKLKEIEEQARIALMELPQGSIAYSRLRHIGILAKFARLKLQGSRVDVAESMGESSGQPANKQH